MKIYPKFELTYDKYLITFNLLPKVEYHFMSRGLGELDDIRSIEFSWFWMRIGISWTR